uniref:Uncharacterized protein n=1 Tax=Anguilla anguilla TaxID=7936 RepID=A0A0E9WC99_ANGAN
MLQLSKDKTIQRLKQSVDCDEHKIHVESNSGTLNTRLQNTGLCFTLRNGVGLPANNFRHL